MFNHFQSVPSRRVVKLHDEPEDVEMDDSYSAGNSTASSPNVGSRNYKNNKRRQVKNACSKCSFGSKYIVVLYSY